MLRLHLMINGMNRFRSSLDSKDKPFRLEFLLERGDKRSYICLALRFFGIQRVRDIFIGVVVQKLQRKVFHLRLDLVQTQPVRHRSVQILRLFSYMTTAIRIAFFIQLTE